MAVASNAAMSLMREICGQRTGTIYVSEQHLASAVKTRKSQGLIGKDSRADRLRGWLAAALNQGTAILLDPEGLEWMGPRERKLALLGLQILDSHDAEARNILKTTLDIEEAKGAVLTWAAENEEPPRNGEPVVLRKEKRAQLRTARHRVWKALGEGSMNAVILLLLLSRTAYPEVDPGIGWIQESARWASQRGWLTTSAQHASDTATNQLAQMRARTKSRDGKRSADTVLDLGEGWGSIGTAAEAIGCSSIGVDNAGILYQGNLHGHIRARVNVNFADQLSPDTNLLRKIAKKAGITLGAVMAVWLSPECTLLSKANCMNTSRGCAHGPYAEHPANIAAATPQRLLAERAKYAACLRSIEEQMRALEEDNPIFMLENPEGSHFWELDSVTKRVARMAHRGWRIHRVDQCAFGRKAQKATMILTNLQWNPCGITGTGRCLIGQCAGTLGNIPGTPGSGKHEQQTVTNEGSRRTRLGDAEKGARGDYSVVAAKNRVETMLVQELLQAARAQWHRPTKRRRVAPQAQE